MVIRNSYVLSLLSAILMSVPFLVPHTGFIALIALVPLLYMDKTLSERRAKRVFPYLYLTFLLFNIFTTWWIFNISKGGAIAAIILNALQMSAVFAIYRWSKNKLGKDIALSVLATLWVAWEHVYSNTEVAWPWLSLGNSLATSPELAQWYDIFGTTGGSLWIITCNILVFKALSTTRKKAVWRTSALTFIIIPVVCSVVKYHSYKESDDPIEIVVAQPNIDPFMKFGVMSQTDIDNGLFDLVAPYMTEETEFLFAPETFTFNLDLDHLSDNQSIQLYAGRLADYPNTDFIFGALGHRIYKSAMQPSTSARFLNNGYWYDSFNLAVAMDCSTPGGISIKSKLVPGAERLPYMKFLKFLGPIFENMGGGASSYGSEDAKYSIGMKDGRKTGVMICYESVFGDFCRNAVLDGAEFMAAITNDGWWGDTPGHTQHFNYARLRAIEYRRDVVHVANTGTSGIINQRGDVMTATPWWERMAFRATVNGNNTITPFVRKGDVAGRLCGYYFLIMLFTVSFLYVSGTRFSCGTSEE